MIDDNSNRLSILYLYSFHRTQKRLGEDVTSARHSQYTKDKKCLIA